MLDILKLLQAKLNFLKDLLRNHESRSHGIKVRTKNKEIEAKIESFLEGTRTATGYKCKDCPKFFSYIVGGDDPLILLRRHIIRKHLKSELACSCGKICNSLEERAVHTCHKTKMKSVPKLYTCDICGLKAATIQQLRKHIENVQ